MTNKYVSPHPKPTPHEREILTILSEECAEIIVAVSKILRFGAEDGNPGTGETNRDALSREIGDLDAVLVLARGLDLISQSVRVNAVEDKFEKLSVYLQTTP